VDFQIVLSFLVFFFVVVGVVFVLGMLFKITPLGAQDILK